jgi:hypothetical protein
MKLKFILISFSCLLVFFLLVGFSILPSPNPQNCVKVSAEVSKVFEGGGENDIVIFLKDDPNYYYINRGLERGLELEQLKEQISNNTVTLIYIKHWSPLNPMNRTRHIAKLMSRETILYSELN